MLRRPTAGNDKFYGRSNSGSTSRVDLGALMHSGKTGAPLSGPAACSASASPPLPHFYNNDAPKQSQRSSRSFIGFIFRAIESFQSKKFSASHDRQPSKSGSKFTFTIRSIYIIIFGTAALLLIVVIHAYIFQSKEGKLESTGGSLPNSDQLPAHMAAVINAPPISAHLDTMTELVANTADDKNADADTDRSSKYWHPPLGWKLTPLRQIDIEQYTVRINSWKRPEQLVVSVHHLLSCPNVATVQIIWCDKSIEPPEDIIDQEDVIIERHDLNSLNERFRILSPTPTLGILNIDDDVLRPCEAMDSGFFRWTRSPERMVGFDGRLHIENDDGSWQYGYLSTMKSANKYSISLTRFCFVHRDYLDLYINHLPSTMLERVAKTFNCEDIAMSFMISSLTGGKSPLLADYWAIGGMIKLHTAGKISAGKEHKALRDNCVNDFAELFGMKDESTGRRLKSAKFIHSGHGSWLECGDRLGSYKSNLVSPHLQKSSHQIGYESLVEKMIHYDQDKRRKAMSRMFAAAGSEAYEKGFIKDSSPWKKRFGHGR